MKKINKKKLRIVKKKIAKKAIKKKIKQQFIKNPFINDRGEIYKYIVKIIKNEDNVVINTFKEMKDSKHFPTTQPIQASGVIYYRMYNKFFGKIKSIIQTVDFWYRITFQFNPLFEYLYDNEYNQKRASTCSFEVIAR